MNRLMMLLSAGCLMLALARAEEPPQANNIEVSVKRIHVHEQAMFEVRASGFVTAAPERIWKVLTDYNRLPEFVPNLSATKILSRSGNEVMIAQIGSGGFLFVKRTIHLVVRALEYPPTHIDVNLVSGDMKHYSVRWEVAPTTIAGISGARLRFGGTLEPDFFIPPLLGSGIVEDDIKKMMQAVVAEILKAP